MPTIPSKRLKFLAIVGLVAIWGLGLAASNAGAYDDPPPLHSTIGQFTVVKPVRPAPQDPLRAPDGKVVKLGDFKGKVVLLNFWATWCGPCIREMPSLQRLQEALGGEKFVVVAVSIDRRGYAKVTPFLERLRITKLTILLDIGRKLYRKFGVRGLPTTALIDHEGRVRGYLEGPAEWDSKEALALIRYYVKLVPAPTEQKKASSSR